MKWFAILLGLVCIIWEIVFLPKVIEKNIRKEVKDINGVVISIKSIGRREAMYLVEYKIGEELIRNNVRCNWMGKIEEWI
nr:hypothetical protein [uncultured Cellulosilyticum sp.]